ncbi:MAG: nuclear transport factor 2 family protein [Chitinophagaceae bacterium]|nr:nuclear transport factor 2 family protein [Chitinophagaceae bacterium]
MSLVRRNIIPGFAIMITLISSCSSKPDLVKEAAAIRNLLEQEQKAHFARDADLFVAEFADSMISVNRGVVKVPGLQENKERISKYFSSVQFIKWDDLADPIIRFSDDASLAYAVIQKEVILTYPDTSGKPFYDTTRFAWTSVYRKHGGEWKVECNTSTNQ